MKAKLKELTSRNNGWSNEYRAVKLTQFIRGWVNYFAMADMKQLLRITDEWLRRGIRAIYWKQWKKIKTRYRMIRKFGLPEWKVHEMANCRKGIWRSAIMLNSVLTNKGSIINVGVCENMFPSFVFYYKIKEASSKMPVVQTHTFKGGFNKCTLIVPENF